MSDGSKGTWPAGKSGNARGRPKKQQCTPLATPADLYEVVMKVANLKTKVNFEGCDRKVTVYEANVMGMAAGSGQTRLARKAFTTQVENAASRLELARKKPK